MGHMRHHAIVVTAFTERDGETAHDYAESLGCAVSSIVVSPYEYWTFLVGPDGCKEGWPESVAGDARRDRLIDWMREQLIPEEEGCPYTWVEVQYADDDFDTRVTRSSDHDWVEG